MIGIYKFENKINKKVYIGQSINLERRYQDHYKNHANPNLKDFQTKFYRALRKYGFENFTYEIIEEDDTYDPDTLDEREIYWIKYYDSYNNGYNSTIGGHLNLTTIGENHPMAKLTNKEVLEIKDLLKNSRETEYEIANKYKVTQSLISEINNGERWTTIGINEKYPLRSIGKLRTGENNPKAVFTDKEVIEIRKRYVNETGKQIYEDYKEKSSYKTFERLLSGRTYSHLPIYKKKEKKWINN